MVSIKWQEQCDYIFCLNIPDILEFNQNKIK